jgi:cell division septation protein DedD
MRFLLIHYSRASQINHHLQIFVRFMLRISAFNRRANAEEVAWRLQELKWRAYRTSR